MSDPQALTTDEAIALARIMQRIAADGYEDLYWPAHVAEQAIAEARRECVVPRPWIRLIDHAAEHIKPVPGCVLCDRVESNFDRAYVEPAK